MGTYAWAALGSSLLLGVVLWFGFRGAAPRVEVQLAPDGRWTGATLDDGQRCWELHRGQGLSLPPGQYVLTLFDEQGGSDRRTLQLRSGQAPLGAPLSDDAAVR